MNASSELFVFQPPLPSNGWCDADHSSWLNSMTNPGAPILTGMRRKLIWTTIISAIIYGLGMAAYQAGYLSVERLSKLMGMPF